MKKVLSFVLVLSLVLSSFSMAFAGIAADDVAGKDCEVAVGALTELGVVNGYEDGTFRPENAVNRAEAAKLVVTALGLSEYAAGNTASFTDLAGYEWAAGYIGYAEALGILKGDGNGCFRPADTVSYQEMATMLVRALGYTDECLPGTWPANYVVKAKALGILKGINQVGSAAANRGDVAIMLYNNLSNPIGTVDKDNNWDPSEEGDSMLGRLERSTYDATNYFIKNDARTNEEVFVLNNGEKFADGVNLANYYGAAVIAYENDADEIVGIKEVRSTFLTGKMDGDKFVADDVEYTFADGARARIAEFENGLAKNDFARKNSVTTDKEVTLAVEVSGKTIKDVYSESIWDGTDLIWTAEVAKTFAKTAKISGDEFVMDDNQEIDTTSFVLVGVDSLDKIAEDSIVTVYVNNKITKIEVSTKTVEGVVTKMTKDNDLVINGTVYAVAETTDSSASSLGLEDEGTFFLNYAGDIFAFEGTPASKNYAVVVDVVRDFMPTGYATTSTYAIELFLADGTQKVMEIDEDALITLEEGAANATEGAVSGGAANVAENTVIAYELNKDGLIKGIVVPKSHTASKLTTKGYLDKYEVASNVVVFTGNADDDFALAKMADIEANAELVGTYYVLEEGVVVAVITNESTGSNPYGLVVDYGTIKVDGEVYYEVDLLVDGKVTTYVSNDSFDPSVLGTLDRLFDITIKNGELETLAGLPGSYQTVVEVKGGNIALSEGQYEDVRSDVVVFEAVYDGSDFVKFVEAELSDIAEGDSVKLYDANTDEGHEGIEVVIFKVAE